MLKLSQSKNASEMKNNMVQLMVRDDLGVKPVKM